MRRLYGAVQAAREPGAGCDHAILGATCERRAQP
jgi:hypothetical protein